MSAGITTEESPVSAQEQATPATILKLPTSAEVDLAQLEELNDVVRQMEANEERWRALEAEIKSKIPLSQEALEEQRRSEASRAERFAEMSLARRNIWYRKDASGTSPGERYFAETDEERAARRVRRSIEIQAIFDARGVVW